MVQVVAAVAVLLVVWAVMPVDSQPTRLHNNFHPKAWPVMVSRFRPRLLTTVVLAFLVHHMEAVDTAATHAHKVELAVTRNSLTAARRPTVHLNTDHHNQLSMARQRLNTAAPTPVHIQLKSISTTLN